jgi:hypothetical protein
MLRKGNQVSGNRFPLPFAGEVIYGGMVGAGVPSLLLPGTWKFDGKKKVYRKLGEDGQTAILPSHGFQGGGVVYEYALLQDQGKEMLVFWRRF